jgi:type II secretory pathway pseudopilin PulG
VSAFRDTIGFSIVEIIVSGAIATISLSAVLAVVTTGSDLAISDNERRQVRTIMRSTYEQKYDYRSYSIVPDTLSRIESVDIDPREGSVLHGELSTKITRDSVNTGNGTMIPVKRIVMVMKWYPTNSCADSIILTKVLAEAL